MPYYPPDYLLLSRHSHRHRISSSIYNNVGNSYSSTVNIHVSVNGSQDAGVGVIEGGGRRERESSRAPHQGGELGHEYGRKSRSRYHERSGPDRQRTWAPSSSLEDAMGGLSVGRRGGQGRIRDRSPSLRAEYESPSVSRWHEDDDEDGYYSDDSREYEGQDMQRRINDGKYSLRRVPAPRALRFGVGQHRGRGDGRRTPEPEYEEYESLGRESRSRASERPGMLECVKDVERRGRSTARADGRALHHGYPRQPSRSGSERRGAVVHQRDFDFDSRQPSSRYPPQAPESRTRKQLDDGYAREYSRSRASSACADGGGSAMVHNRGYGSRPPPSHPLASDRAKQLEYSYSNEPPSAPSRPRACSTYGGSRRSAMASHRRPDDRALVAYRPTSHERGRGQPADRPHWLELSKRVHGNRYELHPASSYDEGSDSDTDRPHALQVSPAYRAPAYTRNDDRPGRNTNNAVPSHTHAPSPRYEEKQEPDDYPSSHARTLALWRQKEGRRDRQPRPPPLSGALLRAEQWARREMSIVGVEVTEVDGTAEGWRGVAAEGGGEAWSAELADQGVSEERLRRRLLSQRSVAETEIGIEQRRFIGEVSV